MSLMRERALDQFPTVLLTLLSIVQALALELLWEHIQQSEGLFEMSGLAAIAWLQIVVTLAGIILIWVAYASHAMRFRWVPSTADSVYPFLIGLLEFVQIATLGPNMVGQWTMLMAIIFAAMVLVSHSTLRRARLSGENGDFFDHVNPATLRDFIPQIFIIALLLVGGALSWLFGNLQATSLVLILLVSILLLWQYISSAQFWRSSISS